MVQSLFAVIRTSQKRITLRNELEGSDYFSVEVIMDIISSLITNAITIIGLIVTYHMMKLQFVNQSKNAKEQEVLEKMSDIPYEILDLMTEMQQPGFKANNRFERKLSDLWSKIYAYGSQETIRILSKMFFASRK